MISRIHHVQITIPKGAEQQARAFYCDLLGLSEVAKTESLAGRGGFWLEIGDQQIHVGSEDGIDRRASKAHIAYQVTNLDHWKLKLEAAGCEIGDSIPLPGFNRFESRDPFGNRIEFIEPMTSLA
jgi:catechol 2,3-dioxygenase-like lactoylglutathione lyase family enzyme